MVREIVVRYFEGDLKYVEMYGLNKDDKPVTGLVTGSKFTEVDTGDVYLFDETESGTWTKVQAGYVDPTTQEGD